MTTIAYIILTLSLLVAILNGLPVAGALPEGVSSAIVLIVGYMKAWNYFFPITELFVCTGIVLGYEIIVWTMQALFRAFRSIRGMIN